MYQVPATRRALVWALRTEVNNTGMRPTLLKLTTSGAVYYLSLKNTGMHQGADMRDLAGPEQSHCSRTILPLCRRHSNPKFTGKEGGLLENEDTRQAGPLPAIPNQSSGAALAGWVGRCAGSPFRGGE